MSTTEKQQYKVANFTDDESGDGFLTEIHQTGTSNSFCGAGYVTTSSKTMQAYNLSPTYVMGDIRLKPGKWKVNHLSMRLRGYNVNGSGYVTGFGQNDLQELVGADFVNSIALYVTTPYAMQLRVECNTQFLIGDGDVYHNNSMIYCTVAAIDAEYESVQNEPQYIEEFKI